MPMIGTRWGRMSTCLRSPLSRVTRPDELRGAKAGLHGATKALALELRTAALRSMRLHRIIESGMTESVFSRDAIEKFCR